jgi:CRISPR/Cas system CMR subunit Cmr6 (Cas7 group RAMP superfamily)
MPEEFLTTSFQTNGAAQMEFTKVQVQTVGKRPKQDFVMKSEPHSHVSLLALRSTLPQSAVSVDGFESAFCQAVADHPIDKLLLSALHTRHTEFLKQLETQGWTVAQAEVEAIGRVSSGRESTPHNTGISRDHLSGVVHLPASGLKGTVTNIFEAQDAEDHTNDQPPVAEQTQAELAVTSILFSALAFDYKVIVDVITPHESVWHASTSSHSNPPVPNRRTEPVPVPFLAIERGARFRLSAAKYGRHDKTDLLKDLLHALYTEGFGSRTSHGFGYFKKVAASQ